MIKIHMVHLKNKNKNNIIKRNKNNIAIIELFNNKKELVVEVLVDDLYYHELNKFSWHKNDSGYATGSKTTLKKRMHRYIFENILNQDIQDDLVIDHINNNRLDNRIDNLRIVTKKINSYNMKKQKNSTSKYFGISKVINKNSIKWVYQIYYNSKKITARFNTENEAMIARNNYIIKNNLPYKLN